MMRPVQSRFADAYRAVAGGLASRAILSTVVTATAVAAAQPSSQAVVGAQRPHNLERVHASDGWGRPAVDATGAYYLSAGHELFALDRQVWRERWRRHLAARPGITAGTQVVARGDRILAGDGDLFAVSAATGALLWQRGAADGDGVDAGRFLGAVSETIAWAGSGSGVVSALDIATGERRWRQTVGNERTTVFAPVVRRRLLVAAYSDFASAPRAGGLVALDAETGRLLWKAVFPRTTAGPASAGGTPAIIGDTVVCAATDGTLYGFHAGDGTITWTLPPVAVSPLMNQFEDFSPIALSPPLLLAGSLSGVLRAIEPQAGRVLWRYESPADGSHGFSIEAAGHVVFLPTGSGRMLVVHVGTGQLIQAVGGGTPRFDWPPAVADGELVLVAEDGLYVGCTDDSRRKALDEDSTGSADGIDASVPGPPAGRLSQRGIALGPICRYLAGQRHR